MEKVSWILYDDTWIISLLGFICKCTYIFMTDFLIERNYLFHTSFHDIWRKHVSTIEKENSFHKFYLDWRYILRYIKYIFRTFGGRGKSRLKDLFNVLALMKTSIKIYLLKWTYIGCHAGGPYTSRTLVASHCEFNAWKYKMKLPVLFTEAVVRRCS